MTQVNWTAFTDLAQLPGLANDVTNGSFWTGILYMLWIVMLLILIGYGFEIALLTSSFLALILGFLLSYGSLVPFAFVIPFIAVVLLMVLYLYWSRPEGK